MRKWLRTNVPCGASRRAESLRSLCTPAVTKCPHCGGSVLHRHGTTRSGEQRFRCHDCRRTFTRFSNRFGSHIRKRNAFERYLEMLHAARPVREDAKKLGVAPSTVWRWRHQVIRFLSKRRNEQRLHWQGDAVAATHFIGRRRRFWGVTSEALWAYRHGLLSEWFMVRGRGIPGTLVHFITEVREGDAGNITIEIGEGSILHPCIPKSFVAKVLSQPKYWEYRGERLFPVSYHDAPDDMIQLAKKPRMSPIRLWTMRYQKETAAPLDSPVMRKTARKARELCHLFLGWSARFRGISLKYLERYIAWFLEELKLRRLKISLWMFPNLAG